MRGLIVAGWCLLTALDASAQRVQFPTMVEESAVTSPPLSPIAQAPALPPNAGAPLTQPPLTAPPQGFGAAAPPFDPYAAGGAAAPAPTPYSPYAPSPYAAPPPYSTTPGALYPEGIQTPQLLPQEGFSFNNTLRFMQEVRGRYTWISPMGSNSLGLNVVDLSATFAIPFLRTTNPLLITPGFSANFFEGPETIAPDFADLPPVTYDAFLDTAWHPQLTPWFGANLGVRIGAYTDFNTFTTDSIRIMGRGLGVITLTPTLQIAAGVVYLDRVLIKLLPAGGVIWTPNPDARYEFLFPNPKLARRLTTLGNTDLWIYGFGEYGGGSWTIQRNNPVFGNFNDQADYNDIRFGGGLETFGFRGMHGWFEVAYVFNRQIIYRSATPEYNPSDSIMLRAGLSY
jgi:hypothetical protein